MSETRAGFGASAFKITRIWDRILRANVLYASMRSWTEMSSAFGPVDSSSVSAGDIKYAGDDRGLSTGADGAFVAGGM